MVTAIRKSSVIENKASQDTSPLKMKKELFKSFSSESLLKEASNQLKILEKNDLTEEEKIAAHTYIFDLGDYIFRQIWENPSTLEDWKCEIGIYEDLKGTPIDRAIHSKNLNEERRKKVLVDCKISDIAASLSKKYVAADVDKSAPALSSRSMKILQSSVETPIHRFAGLGSVVTDLAIAHKKWKRDDEQAPSYQGFYPLYESDKYRDDAYLSDFVPYAVVCHLYDNREVRSVVYKSKSKQAFLVSPDEKFKDIFCLSGTDLSLYSNCGVYSYKDRGRYLASTLASFSMLYRGAKGDKKVDLVRADGLCVASPCFAIMNNTKAQLQGSSFVMPKKIAILHGPSDEVVDRETYLGIGANQFRSNVVSVVAKLADRTIPVSRHYERCLHSDDYQESEEVVAHLSRLERIGFKNRSRPITNGFNPESYDPSNPAVTGIFARNLDTEIISNPTAFTDLKAEITQALYQAGKIGSPMLPIVCYVGRFHQDKGIDVLPAMIEKSLEKGAQVVIMGVACGDEKADKVIDIIRKMAEKNPLIRLYGKDEQLEKFSYINENGQSVDTKAKLGMLIRSATMLGLVPSHKEPMGLVPLETTQSCPVLAPFHEGFTDTLIPYVEDHLDYNLEKDSNAFTYKNSQSETQALRSLTLAFEKFIHLEDKKLQNRMLMNIRTKTAKKHTWYNSPKEEGVVFRLTSVYDEACKEGLSTVSYVLPANASAIEASSKTKDFLSESNVLREEFFEKKKVSRWNKLKNAIFVLAKRIELFVLHLFDLTKIYIKNLVKTMASRLKTYLGSRSYHLSVRFNFVSINASLVREF